ncbi:MAG: malto-oligosyltrehalose trehalohydrolase [Acidobacteriota bacterium]
MPDTPDGRAPWRSRFGARVAPGGADVRVWAPDVARVAVRLEGGTADVPLAAEADGLHAGYVPGLVAGARYRVVAGEGPALPDPASRSQPDGVHGASAVVDPGAFAWAVHQWPLPPLDRLVVYELHVGTFTPEGTFAAAAARLPWLVSLGVTAVELMPVAAFPGRRNWGYDGAALYAPAAAYGSPDDLRRFVDAAHGLGLGVILDVVYNHFGPDGAYTAALSRRFFSERHRNPWGAGINLDGAGSRQVRDFFIDNAQHWIHEYRFDGLRLDATHALVDHSSCHFVAELAAQVRASAPRRTVWVIAEDHRNLRTIVDPPSAGGWGLDAVWADDLHHVLRRLTAGDDEGYYADFQGTPEEVARTLDCGWLYQGGHAPHFGGPRGTDSTGLPRSAFVVCIQNHDQIGNRANGDRLHHAVDEATWRALSLLLLLAPETPLLFMGQEWAASSPFQYFTDHHDELGRLVRDGRRNEFRHFRAFSDPARRQAIPDPQADATFERSRLRWEEIERPRHARVVALYRDALALRRGLAPGGRAGEESVAAPAEGATGVTLRRRRPDGTALAIVACLRGDGRVRLPAPDGPRPAARIALDTEDPRYAADPRPPRLADEAVTFARPGAIVLEWPASGARQ